MTEFNRELVNIYTQSHTSDLYSILHLTLQTIKIMFHCHFIHHLNRVSGQLLEAYAMPRTVLIKH